MNQTKIGEIGIEDIPVIQREDLFKTHFPLSQELSESIQGTIYMDNTNNAYRIASNLHEKGGNVYYSEEAKKVYGTEQVYNVFKYYDYFRKLDTVEKEIRMGVIAWIADNIFDLEKMKLEE